MKLAVILIAAALAVTSAQAESPPITIQCTFPHVDLPTNGKYSRIKVAPKDMAWHNGADPTRAHLTEGWVRGSTKDKSGPGFIVIGTGISVGGEITAKTDLPKLLMQFSQLASDHGANAINYQMVHHGTQISVQFLRVEDEILKAGRLAPKIISR